jgi:hypothetical protein
MEKYSEIYLKMAKDLTTLPSKLEMEIKGEFGDIKSKTVM